MSIVFAPYRTFVCLALALNFVAAEMALAAEQGGAETGAATAGLAAAQDFGSDQGGAPVLPLVPGAVTSASLVPPAPGSQRPSALVPLYVSLAALQASDIHSTLKALNRGAVEANPIMRGVIGSPAAVIALKAAFTGVMISSSEKLWKKNRAAAILLMVGVNGAYGAIVAHNYSVARSYE
jgi:hypothetical protein